MVNVTEAIYNKGKVSTENIIIPDNTKVLIIWENNYPIYDNNQSNKLPLPKGISFDDNNILFDVLDNFPKDAVEFQRMIRDRDWN